MADTKRVKKVYLKGYAKNQTLLYNDRLVKALSVAQEVVSKKRERMLDVGCGDGSFTELLGKSIQIKKMYGIDIAPDAVRKAKTRGIEAKLLDTDLHRFPFPSAHFDFIYCGNLVELVADADHLLMEINRVLKKDGVVIMTFPNIASWLSRIALLFGFLPYYSRISTQYDLGKMFVKTTKGQSTGFIRLFNISSFTELAKLYGLKVEKTYGVREQALPMPLQIIDKLFSRRPQLAFKIICVLTKA
jgi:methionine biosynthesis protein MetW